MTFTNLMTLTPQGEDRFVAAASPDKGARTFGGQFLAQTLRAAQATVDGTRAVNSLHAYFLRPGDPYIETQMRVERVREGRSFCSRQVVAAQNNKELFRVNISLQVPDETPVYQAESPPEVPPPESVSTTYVDFALPLMGKDSWAGSNRPIDILYINPPTTRGVPITEAQLMWLKLRHPIPDDAALHAAGLAYLSDATLVDHVMLPHGLRWQDSDFTGASLDHCMWFHAPCRADEWLLFVQNVEATGRGRGLARGRFYTRDGILAATCMQEGLIRWA